MSAPVSPVAMIATSMQAQPGVYALLLGSGVSTAAGMPTGWGVVKDLVRRVAAAEHPGNSDELASAESDPEKWWSEHHGVELEYSSLLQALAPTQATRQGLLSSYFEPSDEDRAAGVKAPTKAHRAIAQLVKRGAVRVVLTTNFDRLMEQALEAEGVAAQVITRPEAVKGMSPLAHAPATLIKLHGDYKDLTSLNTPEELSAYPMEWQGLIRQILDEYGLIVAGWSADWDTALVSLMESTPSRRYPLYWDKRSSRGANAQRLLLNRSGILVPASDADALFSELATSLEALDRLAEPPLTSAMAVARLKRYLPDPVRRIDLHDLVMGAADAAIEGINGQTLSGIDQMAFQRVLERHREESRLLRTLLVTGIWHDLDGVHDRLWMDVIGRLLGAGTVPVLGVPILSELDHARLYPALLTVSAAGVTAVLRGRDRLLVRIATEVTSAVDRGVRVSMTACQIAHPARVLSDSSVNMLPRWEGKKWIYPISHLLNLDTRDVFTELIPRDDEYSDAFHAFEYRMSLLQEFTNRENRFGYRAMPGEYVGETAWSWDDRDVPAAEDAFRAAAQFAIDWPWTDLLGGDANYDKALVDHREILKTYKRYRM